ncbi:MAG TPA: DUF6331 family protein [Gemmataceae bacterium]|nr:DUF6331 family protein [Gemmataceae bacterium]
MPDETFQIVYPDPLREVYGQVQVCLPECCGDEAFDTNAWRFLDWFRINGCDRFLQALDQVDDLIDTIARHPVGSFRDKDWDWTEDRAGCLDYYENLRSEMLRALYHEMGPAVFDPRWLSQNARAVEALARQMADRGRYETAGILADALEEAGCESFDLLSRCRRSKVHANWVVQLLLLGADGILARPIEPTPERRTNPAPVAQ